MDRFHDNLEELATGGTDGLRLCLGKFSGL